MENRLLGCKQETLAIYISSIICITCLLKSIPILLLTVIIYVLLSPALYESKNVRYGIYFSIACCISYINLSKPIAISDLGYYYWLYQYVGKQDFLTYFQIIPKEALFHIYTYIMYYLTLGHFSLFLYLNTIIIYVLLFFSYDIVLSTKKMDMRYAISAVLLLAFFVEFFFYTAQIVRQVLAGAIAMYCITKSIYSHNKLAFIGIASAGFIHSSAFLFYIFYLYKLKKKKTRTYLLLSTIITLGTYLYFLPLISGFFSNESTISYAIRRGTSVQAEQVNIAWLPILVCISILPISLYLIIKSKDLRLNLFLITPIFLTTCICLNFKNSLFVLRFMEYIYMYIPIVITLLLHHFKKEKILLLLVIAMAIRFSLKLNHGDFEFMEMKAFIFSGMPNYLFTIFK